MYERLNSAIPGNNGNHASEPNANQWDLAVPQTLSPRTPVATLVCPNAEYRSPLKRMLEGEGARVAAFYESYPGHPDLPALIEAGCDAYVVEIDSDQAVALQLVETLCTRRPASTVMVYSALHDQDRMVASMRAGAREFLTESVSPQQLREALVRAVLRNVERIHGADGKTMVFWSAKGGSGVSTLAANFAIALRMEADAPVLLADLNPQIGDLSVLLGIKPRFTVTEALKNADRLDTELLATVVAAHPSGVSLAAAPDMFDSSIAVDSAAVAKFLAVASSGYRWVVIDAGRSLGAGVEPVFQMASVIYLVTQLDVPSLRSAQRFISYVQRTGNRQIEVIVNRYDPRRSEFDDESIAKTLGLPPKWKIPNDYAAASRAANTGNALILERSPAAHALRALARSACGKPPEMAPRIKKGSWKIFG